MNIEIGQELQHNNQLGRVVRIIDRSITLFEEETGEQYLLDESYAELKLENGDVDFIILRTEKQTYSGPSSQIKGLAPIPWRVENVNINTNR